MHDIQNILIYVRLYFFVKSTAAKDGVQCNLYVIGIGFIHIVQEIRRYTLFRVAFIAVLIPGICLLHHCLLGRSVERRWILRPAAVVHRHGRQ